MIKRLLGSLFINIVNIIKLKIMLFTKYGQIMYNGLYGYKIKIDCTWIYWYDYSCYSLKYKR